MEDKKFLKFKKGQIVPLHWNIKPEIKCPLCEAGHKSKEIEINEDNSGIQDI
jgi:hypothetical protein